MTTTAMGSSGMPLVHCGYHHHLHSYSFKLRLWFEQPSLKPITAEQQLGSAAYFPIIFGRVQALGPANEAREICALSWGLILGISCHTSLHTLGDSTKHVG